MIVFIIAETLVLFGITYLLLRSELNRSRSNKWVHRYMNMVWRYTDYVPDMREESAKMYRQVMKELG